MTTLSWHSLLHTIPPNQWENFDPLQIRLAKSLSMDILSPDLTSSDFHLFLHLKSFLAGKHFNNDKELKENVSNWLKTQAATFYEEGIEKLVPRYDTCLQNFGSYVER
ncbi:histone-lysine N-methyltransferase SETMAR [Trichonephila clavipes]|nr:histone-lysine N-methyltransferase SETMAR [Trichonephila clavipes]